MKRQYHTLHSSRGARLRSLLFALLSGSILLCSCADDLSSSASSRQLTFTPTVSSSWNQGTRSVSGPDVPQSMVTALEGYSRPLYLHTYYTDSIASPGSGSKTITRAAPITANAMFDKFGVSVRASQLFLFVFLAAFAIGTVAGGMLGDRFGRKYVIWFSILGAAPFALAMPYVGLTWTIVCCFLSGLIIASAFSSIVVYATDLMPDKVGMIAGVFFGLMFGLGGLGSAFFGWLADKTSIEFIFQVSAFLPLLGIIAGLLPNTQKTK